MNEYLPHHRLHIFQHKVRLTEADDAAIRDLAARTDVPPAVLLRAIVRDYLERGAAVAVSHVAGEVRRGQ